MADAKKSAPDCWEVEILSCTTVYVRGAKNEEEAYEFAQNEVSMDTTRNMVEMRCNKLDDERAIESSRRHADYRSEE